MGAESLQVPIDLIDAGGSFTTFPAIDLRRLFAQSSRQLDAVDSPEVTDLPEGMAEFGLERISFHTRIYGTDQYLLAFWGA